MAVSGLFLSARSLANRRECPVNKAVQGPSSRLAKRSKADHNFPQDLQCLRRGERIGAAQARARASATNFTSSLRVVGMASEANDQRRAPRRATRRDERGGSLAGPREADLRGRPEAPRTRPANEND